MNSQTFKAILKSRKLRPSQVASDLAVSRQTVNTWLHAKNNIHIKSDHLFKLSQLLNVPMESFFIKLPTSNTRQKKELMSTLLWDRLYPSIEDLVIAALEWQHEAIARLVQTYGFITTSRLLMIKNSRAIYDRYPVYKKYIHPQKRKILDNIWEINCNPV